MLLKLYVHIHSSLIYATTVVDKTKNVGFFEKKIMELLRNSDLDNGQNTIVEWLVYIKDIALTEWLPEMLGAVGGLGIVGLYFWYQLNYGWASDKQ